MYYKCLAGEKIKYVDVCSLYPYICKTGTFPIGHPKILTENFNYSDLAARKYTGIIKCTVIPPRGLFHLVLPARFNGKLLFALCRTCAAQQLSDCDHDDDARAITGEWVSLELYAAMDRGYRVRKTSLNTTISILIIKLF
jgi:DNA polymerase type B, organellar and viral